nr:hypothetical protein [Pimelobacter sp. 30-1]
MREREQVDAEGGEGDGGRGVHVGHRGEVVARGQHLGVDRVLQVPRPVAGEHRAVPADQQHVAGAHLGQADAVALHPHPAARGIAQRDVPPDVVVADLAAEDPAGDRDLLAQGGGVGVRGGAGARHGGSSGQDGRDAADRITTPR